MLLLRLPLPTKFISFLVVKLVVVAPVEVGEDGLGRRKWGKECSVT